MRYPRTHHIISHHITRLTQESPAWGYHLAGKVQNCCNSHSKALCFIRNSATIFLRPTNVCRQLSYMSNRVHLNTYRVESMYWPFSFLLFQRHPQFLCQINSLQKVLWLQWLDAKTPENKQMNKMYGLDMASLSHQCPQSKEAKILKYCALFQSSSSIYTYTIQAWLVCYSFTCYTLLELRDMAL